MDNSAMNSAVTSDVCGMEESSISDSSSSDVESLPTIPENCTPIKLRNKIINSRNDAEATSYDFPTLRASDRKECSVEESSVSALESSISGDAFDIEDPSTVTGIRDLFERKKFCEKDNVYSKNAKSLSSLKSEDATVDSSAVSTISFLEQQLHPVNESGKSEKLFSMTNVEEKDREPLVGVSSNTTVSKHCDEDVSRISLESPVSLEISSDEENVSSISKTTLLESSLVSEKIPSTQSQMYFITANLKRSEVKTGDGLEKNTDHCFLSSSSMSEDSESETCFAQTFSTDLIQLAKSPCETEIKDLKQSKSGCRMSELMPMETFSKDTLSIPFHQHLLSQGSSLSSNENPLNLSIGAIRTEQLPVVCPVPETQMSTQLVSSSFPYTNQPEQTVNANSSGTESSVYAIAQLQVEPLDLNEKTANRNTKLSVESEVLNLKSTLLPMSLSAESTCSESSLSISERTGVSSSSALDLCLVDDERKTNLTNATNKLEPDSQCLVDQTPKSSSKCSFISIEEGQTPFHDTLLPLDLTVHKQLDDCPEQFEVFPQESLTESPSYQLAPVVHDETEELAPLDLSTSNPQDLINDFYSIPNMEGKAIVKKEDKEDLAKDKINDGTDNVVMVDSDSDIKSIEVVERKSTKSTASVQILDDKKPNVLCTTPSSELSDADRNCTTRKRQLPEITNESIVVSGVKFHFGGKVFAYRRHGSSWQKATCNSFSKLPDDSLLYEVTFLSGLEKSFVQPKHMALSVSSPPWAYKVGCRVLASYSSREQLGQTRSQRLTGVIIELPQPANANRYLVFFDKGQVQYVAMGGVFLLFEESADIKGVWRECVDWLGKRFLRVYFHLWPMRVILGEEVRIGDLLNVRNEYYSYEAIIMDIDCSLILISFIRDQLPCEWVYKGSNKIETIEKILDTKLAENPLPFCEDDEDIDQLDFFNSEMAMLVDAQNYAANQEKAESQPQPVVATLFWGKKSKKTSTTTAQQAFKSSMLGVIPSYDESPCPPSDPKIHRQSVLKRDVNQNIVLAKPAPLLKRKKPFVHHESCCKYCLEAVDVSEHPFEESKLVRPLRAGFERLLYVDVNAPETSLGPGGVCKTVVYVTPCGISLRNLEDLDEYLHQTNCDVPIDNFCFDPYLQDVFKTLEVPKENIIEEDISKGIETTPVRVVNDIDDIVPIFKNYLRVRKPSRDVLRIMNADAEFLVCCDCKDNCRNKLKCPCCQLTVENTKAGRDSVEDPDAGYDHRTLESRLPFGLFECNHMCSCQQKTCYNRVVQNGVQLRLELFMTKLKGWGVRCRDYVPAGSFVCTYVGELLTEQAAQLGAWMTGDTYLMNLDFMERVDDGKLASEGEEDDSDDKKDRDKTGHSSEEEHSATRSSDSSWLPGQKRPDVEPVMKKKSKPSKKKTTVVVEGPQPVQDFVDYGIRDERHSIHLNSSDESNSSPVEFASSDEGANTLLLSPTLSLADLAVAEVEQENDDDKKKLESSEKEHDRTEESFKELSSGKEKKHLPIKSSSGARTSRAKSDPSKKSRQLLFNDNSPLVLDAMQHGNIGRFINHACEPNLFVQNVFIDTHDLRLPYVAFFVGQKGLPPGTELCWDYGYELGSIPGKVIYCHCGSAKCTKRLL